MLAIIYHFPLVCSGGSNLNQSKVGALLFSFRSRLSDVQFGSVTNGEGLREPVGLLTQVYSGSIWRILARSYYAHFMSNIFPKLHFKNMPGCFESDPYVHWEYVKVISAQLRVTLTNRTQKEELGWIKYLEHQEQSNAWLYDKYSRLSPSPSSDKIDKFALSSFPASLATTFPSFSSL